MPPLKNDAKTLQDLDPLAQSTTSSAGWPEGEAQKYATSCASLALGRSSTHEELMDDQRLVLGSASSLTMPEAKVKLVSQRLHLLAGLECGNENYDEAVSTTIAAMKVLDSVRQKQELQKQVPQDQERDQCEQARALNNLGVLQYVQAENSADPSTRSKLLAEAAAHIAQAKPLSAEIPQDGERTILKHTLNTNEEAVQAQVRLGD